MKAVVAALVLLIVVAVLTYGYWFGVTHGALHITVLNVSDRAHAGEERPVNLLFGDWTGNLLAEAAAWEAVGDLIPVTPPPIYSCREIEKRTISSLEAREDWAVCFERQSR